MKTVCLLHRSFVFCLVVAALGTVLLTAGTDLTARAKAPSVRPGEALTQAVTLNWQNGAWEGRSRASFSVPKIGQGTIVCRPNAQQIIVRPYDQSADTAMWITRVDGRDDGNKPVTVRTAKKTRYSGAQFNEGLNLTSGAKTGNGSFEGIISSQLGRDLPGGSGPPPTTFRLSFYWQFANNQSRCYIAAVFLTERN